MAAHRLGYRVAVLDPDADCPAAGAADVLVQAPLDERCAWEQMAAQCAAITVETENAPVEALRYFARRMRVAPSAEALRIAQDRVAEKRFLAAHGIPVVPFLPINRDCEVSPEQVAGLLPGILKASRLGYDGRGQVRLEHADELACALDALGGNAVLEKRLDLAGEFSVILARNEHGRTAIHPVPFNQHRHGILRTSFAPAELPGGVEQEAIGLARRVAASLDYCGVLCVEFFVDRRGALVVNEIAPRPHNSGHFTVDACVASQFEQQVRTLAGLPLGDPGFIGGVGGAAMVNLLGDLWLDGPSPLNTIVAQGGARLHLYGKDRPRRGRKMGHVTLVRGSLREAERDARCMQLDAR